MGDPRESSGVRVRLDRIASARQALVTAIEQTKPATKYDLYDLYPDAMAVFHSSGLDTFRRLELQSRLAFVSTRAACGVAGISEHQLEWQTRFFFKLLRFFGRFRHPPYWFKEIVLQPLIAAFQKPDRLLQVSWEVRESDPRTRKWYFLEPDGILSDEDYIKLQLEHFRSELEATVDRVRHGEHVPHTRLSMDDASDEPDAAFEWAALWVTGSTLVEIEQHTRRDRGTQAEIARGILDRLEFVGWPTNGLLGTGDR